MSLLGGMVVAFKGFTSDSDREHQWTQNGLQQGWILTRIIGC